MKIFKNTTADPEKLGSLELAFIGDTVFDLLTRGAIVSEGNFPVNIMHKKARSVVNASSQSKMYQAVEGMLDDKELAVMKRGRNAKSHTVPKNQSVADYRRATGIEALFGYLYLQEKYERIEELYNAGVRAVL